MTIHYATVIVAGVITFFAMVVALTGDWQKPQDR